MNLLYINHYAGSPIHGVEFRPFYLAREWVGAGHSVKIVGAPFSHLCRTQPDVHSLSSEKIIGVEYLWLLTLLYSGNRFWQLLNIFVFCMRLVIYAKRIASEFQQDLVIASSTYPMDIWPAN